MNDGSTNVISAITISIFLNVDFALEFLIKKKNGMDAIKPRTKLKSKNLEINDRKLGLTNPSSIPKLTKLPMTIMIIAQIAENIVYPFPLTISA